MLNTYDFCPRSGSRTTNDCTRYHVMYITRPTVWTTMVKDTDRTFLLNMVLIYNDPNFSAPFVPTGMFGHLFSGRATGILVCGSSHLQLSKYLKYFIRLSLNFR